MRSRRSEHSQRTGPPSSADLFSCLRENPVGPSEFRIRDLSAWSQCALLLHHTGSAHVKCVLNKNAFLFQESEMTRKESRGFSLLWFEVFVTVSLVLVQAQGTIVVSRSVLPERFSVPPKPALYYFFPKRISFLFSGKMSQISWWISLFIPLLKVIWFDWLIILTSHLDSQLHEYFRCLNWK